MIRTHIRFPGDITVERVEPSLSSPGDRTAGELRTRDATADEVAAYLRLRHAWPSLSGPKAASYAVDEVEADRLMREQSAALAQSAHRAPHGPDRP